MFPVIAVPLQKPSHATSAARKATSYVASFFCHPVSDITHAFSSPGIALKQVTLEVATAAAVEVALALSATSVARSAILPVRALMLLEEEAAEGEATARSVVDLKRLGMFFLV